MQKINKAFKWTLSVMYVLLLALSVACLILQNDGIHNGLIEELGLTGYIITYGLSYLLRAGFFIIGTLIQLIVFHVKKGDIKAALTPIVIFEVLKIAGTSCFCLMALWNMNFNTTLTRSALSLTAILLFIVTAVCEIIFLIVSVVKSRKHQTPL